MDKYEISLWEDYPDTTPNGIPFLNERKICTIGSDSMRAGARAVEPKLVNNVNGTNTFTFKMYQYYTDEITGEKFLNPFLNLLINERKVKVFWKNKWYDLLIKNLEEDTANKSVTYTCKDSYITELSRNGYNLEYSLDLQNNTGTASELASSVLENSGWYFDAANSTKIIQKTEEAVYEVVVSQSFQAIKQSPLGDTVVQIPSNKKILIFYSSIVDVTNEEKEKTNIQFLYASEGYATDENDMLVLNGDCYTVEVIAQKAVGHVYCYINNSLIIDVNTANGISGQYRAERLVKTQKSEYDKLFDRYVNVYTDLENNNKKVYGYTKTEFSDPITVVNLIANPSKFTGLDGWIGDELNWGLYPKFTRTSSVTDYRATSYLKVNSGYTYNSAISSNQAYLTPSQGDIKNGNTGGFHKGEKYVFRVKAKTNVIDESNEEPGSYVYDDSILPIIAINDDYQPSGSNYFDVGARTKNGDWNEYILTCNTSCPVNDINSLGFFIQVSSGITRWIEDIQFFKYEIGVTSYDPNATEGRINPGEVSLQSVAKTIYRYYNADHDNVKNVEDLSFLYEGEEEQSRFVPVTNNYEKIATIEAKNSNRFNILQSIAESFECWVRFEIDHDETGKTTFNDEGLPNKKVVLVEYIGTDLGWSFEYGIDLKNIKRKVISDSLTTKVLVLPNDNTFAKNGFCTIARSNLNYTKENFVLDFGYYINQGLLNEQMINRDLYSSSNNYLGYYYYLHAYNKEYDEITDILVQKRTELTKQESQLTVLQAQYKAILEELEKCKADVTTLACTDDFDSEKTREYVQSHTDHTKVQSLMNAIGQLKNNKTSTKTQLDNIENSVGKLKRYVKTRTDRQEELAALTEFLHTSFFKKYARYIQEGTWQDQSYIDDDKYYIDAIDVAYTSSRPQLQYDINVMRLAALEDFSSKVFNVGDICYVIDRDFFGYAKDGITPYKLKIIISEVTSYFDTPEKDIIKVQNYKTQFDDLFQRITATTQSLQYAAGGYERAAGAITPDKTLSFDLLQDTFDYNENWVLNASNQQVIWDSTGITITDDRNAALKLKMMAGGLFLSNDGGTTWKNAIRGDGISTDVLTAGRINTSEIYVYDGNHPTFRWDSNGINAYTTNVVVVRDSEGNIIYEGGKPKTESFAFSKYVRFDQFGIYGYAGKEDFVPSTEDTIWYKENPTTHVLEPNSDVRFGLTWKGFFLHGASGASSLQIVSEEDANGDDQITFKLESGTQLVRNKSGQTIKVPVSLEISTDNDILLKTYNPDLGRSIDRIQIGRKYDDQHVIVDYGIWVRDAEGNNIFNVSSEGDDTIGGWNLTKDSFYHTSGNSTIGLYSGGKNATIQGNKADYYILAGSKFGVTIDGNIYASGGKIGGWTINDTTLTGGNITIDSSGNIKCIVNGTMMWELDNAGKGTFHNIFADIGYIAGWHIEPQAIWNDSGTSLNSNLSGSYHIDKYTIVTDSLKASGGSIGGCTVGASSISGGNWSLTPSGGTIGGWSITANSIKGTSIELFSSGSIQISGCTITGYSGGGVSFSGMVYSYSSIVSGDHLSGPYVNVGEQKLESNNVSYLHWLYDNWKYKTPAEV